MNERLDSMLWIDLLIYVVVIGSTIRGLLSGAMASIISLLSVFLAFTEAWRIAPWVRDDVLPWLDLSPSILNGLLVPVVAFFIVYLLLSWTGRLITSLLSRGSLALANRLAGAALGAMLAIYGLGYAFELFDTAVPIPPHQEQRPSTDQDIRFRSTLYGSIRKHVTDLAEVRAYILDVWHHQAP